MARSRNAGAAPSVLVFTDGTERHQVAEAAPAGWQVLEVPIDRDGVTVVPVVRLLGGGGAGSGEGTDEKGERGSGSGGGYGLKALPAGTPSLAISAVPLSPVVEAASDAILLPFADEESIVQTRFATATLALMRAALGHDLAPAIETAEASLAAPLPVDPAEFEHFVFLGHGWTVGLAFEAALKFRETSGAWAEAYPGMEYRHGPISVAGPNTLVWFLGVPTPDLAEAIRVTGATVAGSGADPMAELVTLQRMAVALAQSRGLDPDRPQHLTRSVVLP